MASVVPRQSASIVWFRQDLRLSDNPALAAAVRRGGPVVPLFIWSPDEDGAWRPGGASAWWLYESLKSLDSSLRQIGSRLIIRVGESLSILHGLIRATKAECVFWNRRFDPAGAARDRRIESELRADAVKVAHFNASLLHEPDSVFNQQRRPYQVFTAYWRACARLPEPDAPIEAPRHLPAPATWPRSDAIDDPGLRRGADWARGLRAAWTAGEDAARRRLGEFLQSAFVEYPTARNLPGLSGTSRLSPHLHFGEISPCQVWTAVRERQQQQASANGATSRAAEAYLRELGWREFAHYLLFHFPRTTDRPLRRRFADFPWRSDPQALRAWQRGRTGYPVIDAGMRQLWTTGWMHNRVRMIVGSFLVKHLLIDWREGAAWFWDTLVDADLANNTLGWQWAAGCGADAAPYFRIFNPVLQGRKFDPDGAYVRSWVPELARLDPRWIHAPWEAPPGVLRAAGVELGRQYPLPVVDHAVARQRALAALERTRR